LDHAGYVQVVEAMARRLCGARIMTPRGEVAVEDLAIGDAVLTQWGMTHIYTGIIPVVLQTYMVPLYIRKQLCCILLTC
jgi:hypothetical protein